MAKIALVIGVSNYESDFFLPLPAAARDAEAMQRILQHPDLGRFNEVEILLSPEPPVMQKAIQTLFSGRTKDDLVLLFFSGHGFKDDNGKLHLATRIAREHTRGELSLETSVSANFVQDIMSNSLSRRQVVILDCCFSGAFAEGLLAKDDGSVDIKSQLGGEGRAVLTSSTSTQRSYAEEGADLSVYTRYLIEGIETGAADLDSDGVISIAELHKYTKGKVSKAAPKMKPQIYPGLEGYTIHLSQAPIGDPKLRYRKKVEYYLTTSDVISPLLRSTLDKLQYDLRIPLEDAAAIEDEVLKPYREYHKKLQRYEQALVKAIQRENPLSSDTQNDLKRFQQILSLRDEDIAQIETQIASQKIALLPSNEPATVIPDQLSAQDFYARGNDKYNNADYKGAIEDYNQAIQLKPDHATAYYNRGVAKAKLGDNQGAISDYNQALQINPDDATAYYNRGIAKNKLGDNQGAISDYNQALQINPNYVIAYYNRGMVKEKLGDNQGAISDYNQALQINPNYVIAYYNRGMVKEKLGDNQGAISDYNQALQINPNYANAYYNRGVTKEKLGDNQGAISDYNQALQINPDYVNAYCARGFAKNKLGDNQGAISDYNQALQINPDYVNAYYARGFAKEKLGDNQGAISDYNQALQINPDYVNAYYARGFAKEKLGDNQGAISDYNQALQINPDDADTYCARGFAKEKLGDNQEAIFDYQKAAKLYHEQGKTEYYQDALDKIQVLGSLGFVAKIYRWIQKL